MNAIKNTYRGDNAMKKLLVVFVFVVIALLLAGCESFKVDDRVTNTESIKLIYDWDSPVKVGCVAKPHTIFTISELGTLHFGQEREEIVFLSSETGSCSGWGSFSHLEKIEE
jgi:hypothetical protein